MVDGLQRLYLRHGRCEEASSIVDRFEGRWQTLDDEWETNGEGEVEDEEQPGCEEHFGNEN